MTDINEWEYSHSDEIICPYCGKKQSDSWEYDWSDGEGDDMECGWCEKEFSAWRNVSVTYSSEKKEEK